MIKRENVLKHLFQIIISNFANKGARIKCFLINYNWLTDPTKRVLVSSLIT